MNRFARSVSTDESVGYSRPSLAGLSGRELRIEKPKYPWEPPTADLAAAEKLIHDCGYHRRDEELADA